MGQTTGDLKQIAQIRKAIQPLVGLMKREADADLDDRLARLETAMTSLLKKDAIEITAPEVNVTVETPQALTDALTKLQKSDTMPIASIYEPHDQLKKGTFQYSGFVAKDGNWYIQRVAKGEQRYAKGKGDYSEAWTGLDDLKYGYLDD